MPTYSPTDFCTTDQGLDYIFARMGAIYGAAFTRHWEHVDLSIVRQTWGELLGKYATYKPSMDFALQSMNTSFVPSALAFRELCTQGPRIPDKPHSIITQQPTQAELKVTAQAKEEALRAIRNFTQSVRGVA